MCAGAPKCPLIAGRRCWMLPSHPARQAAGERRGEGEPVLERWSASSHPLCIMRSRRQCVQPRCRGTEMPRANGSRGDRDVYFLNFAFTTFSSSSSSL